MELLDIARKYAIIENRLLGALMMKWQDAKMSNLEYYVIADINPQYWPQNKVKIPECIQPHVAAAMSLGSRRALTLLQTHSLKLGVEVASWNHHTSMKLCNVWNEKLVEDEPHSLNMTCSSYMIIRKKYYDLLEGHGNVIVILKFPSRRVCTYVRAFFSHQ